MEVLSKAQCCEHLSQYFGFHVSYILGWCTALKSRLRQKKEMYLLLFEYWKHQILQADMEMPK